MTVSYSTGSQPGGDLLDVRDRTLWEMVVLRAEALPDGQMLVDEADRRLTFAEFRDQVEQVAAGLAARGIGEGSKVSWQLPTLIETIVTMTALARLGAHQNPIIAAQRERDVFFALRQTEAEFLIMPGVWSDFDYAAMVRGGDWSDRPMPTLITVNRDQVPTGDPATLPAAPHDPDLPRWTYFSTGTTSAPKGVLHCDAGLLAAGYAYAARLGLDHEQVAAIPFSFAHIGGADMLTTMLVAGHSALALERFVPAEAIPLFAKHGATFTGGSVAFGQLLVAEQRKSPTPILPDFRFMVGGSGPTPAAAHEQITTTLNIIYCPAYGMTEVPMITATSPTESVEVQRYTDGALIDGLEMRIVDWDGNVVGPGNEGEIQVKGKPVTCGYLDPALNAEAFVDGWFRTGDLGHVRPDGWVCLTGRVKDIIIRKGEKISAREVEEMLMKHPLVGRVAVIGLPDATRGERICAVVERIPDSRDITFDEMVEYLLAEGLSKYKLPEQLEIIDQLPSAGSLLKIAKAELRKMFADPDGAA
jgi:acyl-CoA synthetase (AMP-forming)/AMP-acid ligase II